MFVLSKSILKRFLMFIDLFPSKVARGKTFCNRINERQQLKENIQQCRHTVLVSPRRYGKTSLVSQTISEIEFPFASVDLFLANDEKTITRRIVNGVADAMNKILPASKKILGKVQEIFKSFKISLGYQAYKLEYSFADNSTANNIDIIYEALMSLLKLAEHHNKTVVFYIDEFQDVTNSESYRLVLGAIRNVAQSSDNLCFIFSGSNRHLLTTLFDDKSMPLYLLCDTIKLNRIYSADYKIHINALAVEKWGEPLEDMTFNAIMKCSEAHAFYVNMLCNRLWKKKTLPKANLVYETWDNCLDGESNRIVAEISALTKVQQDVLKSLALETVNEPFGHKFSSIVGRPVTSIRQSIQALLEKDFIFIVEQEDIEVVAHKHGFYTLVDPLIKHMLCKLI